jgi:hypothetical protein
MRIARSELHEIGEALLASRKDTFVAYLGTSDAVLHLHGRDGARAFLAEVDDYLQALDARVRARSGRGLKIDLVSDHGSTMMGSEVVPVEETLAACGFRRSEEMRGERDVAFALPGIVGSMAITARPAVTEEAARCLAPLAGMDVVAVNRGDSVGVMNADGEAEVRMLADAPERYAYRMLRGDPLGLRALAASATVAGADELVFEQSTLFALTRDGARPDPLRRLWRSFHGEVGHPSSLLLSLRDGYEVGNPKLRFATSLRGGHAGTHGSLTRLSSLGVIASNWREARDVNTGSANAFLFGPEAAPEKWGQSPNSGSGENSVATP